MAEVNRIMEQINRQCENAHIIMGAGIQEALAGRLSVTLVASRQNTREERTSARSTHPSQPAAPEGSHAQDKDIFTPGAAPRPASRFVPPAPALTPQRAEQLLNSQAGGGRSRKKSAALRQGQLQLEIISKGRFEKSEPTIVEGEDLDVPTYIRRGVALN